MRQEMELMSNTKKEIEIIDKEHREVAAFGDITTKQTITCSKSTVEILQQGVKYVFNLTMKTPERCLVSF